MGGPGGYRGGNAGQNASSGLGPGGGGAWTGTSAGDGGSASYGTLGSTNLNGTNGTGVVGPIYGNSFLIPLLGGSGGGGSSGDRSFMGGGGGGAILIAASATIQLNGSIVANGGSGYLSWAGGGGSGSGGAVRLVALTITGSGSITTAGGNNQDIRPGIGRVRFDTYLNNFGGAVNNAVFTQGSQFVVIPTAGSGTQLTIASVADVPVSASPVELSMASCWAEYDWRNQRHACGHECSVAEGRRIFRRRVQSVWFRHQRHRLPRRPH
jgi:hypothetical protein